MQYAVCRRSLSSKQYSRGVCYHRHMQASTHKSQNIGQVLRAAVVAPLPIPTWPPLAPHCSACERRVGQEDSMWRVYVWLYRCSCVCVCACAYARHTNGSAPLIRGRRQVMRPCAAYPTSPALLQTTTSQGEKLPILDAVSPEVR
jgi:hypothetical protein